MRKLHLVCMNHDCSVADGVADDDRALHFYSSCECLCWTDLTGLYEVMVVLMHGFLDLLRTVSINSCQVGPKLVYPLFSHAL